jgi:hypothetical protein
MQWKINMIFGTWDARNLYGSRLLKTVPKESAKHNYKAWTWVKLSQHSFSTEMGILRLGQDFPIIRKPCHRLRGHTFAVIGSHR